MEEGRVDSEQFQVVIKQRWHTAKQEIAAVDKDIAELEYQSIQLNIRLSSKTRKKQLLEKECKTLEGMTTGLPPPEPEPRKEPCENCGEHIPRQSYHQHDGAQGEYYTCRKK